MNARHAHIVITAAVADWAADSEPRLAWIAHCLARHGSGDWGDLDDCDCRANDHAARNRQGRLLSSYAVPAWIAAGADNAVWIITDALDDPDTATTILFPSNY
ncbi:MAG: hypothetical protein AAB131_10620 [Actinomycetota bacterium]